jgi:DnaA-homolog protein
VNDFAPQIPFELFEAEPPSFDNFLVGDNEELVTQLYASSNAQPRSVTTIWGGRSVGKTHLLNASFSAPYAQSIRATKLSADHHVSDSPFSDVNAIIADDVDRYDAEQQAWLFNAFNHVVGRGGFVLAAGGALPPAQWPIRDDLRTRLSSGLVFEVLPVPQEALPALLADYARKRGFELSKEVLTYVLSHTNRDIGALCQLVSNLDRLSLSLKRPITIPLVRAYLTQRRDAP